MSGVGVKVGLTPSTAWEGLLVGLRPEQSEHRGTWGHIPDEAQATSQPVTTSVKWAARRDVLGPGPSEGACCHVQPLLQQPACSPHIKGKRTSTAGGDERGSQPTSLLPKALLHLPSGKAGAGQPAPSPRAAEPAPFSGWGASEGGPLLTERLPYFLSAPPDFFQNTQ